VGEANPPAVISDRPAGSRFGSLLSSARSTATIAAVFLISLSFVLGLLTLLNYFKFDSSLNEISQRRIGIIIDRVHDSIEAAIRLGLNLEDIEIARTVIENTQAQDSRIQSISIFSTDSARTIFASDPAMVGAAANPVWLNAQARATNGGWRMETGGDVVFGRQLDSSLADGIGGVVLTYSLADVSARVDAVRDQLLWGALVTLGIFSVLAALGAIAATRDFRRTISGLAQAINSEEATPDSAILPESLRTAVDRFRGAASDAKRQLDGFEEALARQSTDQQQSAAPHVSAIG
jgi:hypothetical protein